MTTAVLSTRQSDAEALIRRKRNVAYAVPAIIFAYFVYIFFAFDVAGLMKRASFDNAVTLASDSWSYKTHVTRSHRTDEISYAIEGERKGRYPEGTRPDWVSNAGEVTVVDLGGGHEVRLLPGNAMEYDVPGYGTIETVFTGSAVETNFRRHAARLGQCKPDPRGHHHGGRPRDRHALENRNLQLFPRLGAFLLHARQPLSREGLWPDPLRRPDRP